MRIELGLLLPRFISLIIALIGLIGGIYQLASGKYKKPPNIKLTEFGKKHIAKFQLSIFVIIVLVCAISILVVGRVMILDLPYIISGEYPTITGVVVDVHKYNDAECSVRIEDSITKEIIRLSPIYSDHEIGDYVYAEYLPNQEIGYIKTIKEGEIPIDE